MLEVLQTDIIVHLWFSRDGLLSGLGAFLNLLLMMGDSFVPVVPNNVLILVTLGENRLRNFVQAVHSYFSWQRGRFYDHFEDVMVCAARQVIHRTAELYDMDRVDIWRNVGGDDWIVFCNGWRRVFGWTELCVQDEYLPRCASPKISCMRS